MKLTETALALALTAALCACASTSGRKIDRLAVAKIEKGITTRAQLVERFGPPSGSELHADGEEVLTWTYMEAQADATTYIPVVGVFKNGVRSEYSELMVTFKDSTVKDYSLSAEASHLRN